ncbi:DUF4838 domain-containing protein [Candidatus Binatus sp.]|uniref:DUF4838 domain-containing protein n=3 Tax=Candidatus Binatus sp. TaxID=2811406 RepID=UPI003C4F82DA
MSKAGVAAPFCPRVRFSGAGGEVAALAAGDLSSGLAAMLAARVGSSADAALPRAEMRIDLGDSVASAHAAPIALEGDSFDVSRAGGGAGSILIRAGTERGLIHAASNLLEKLGAQFPPGAAPSYPRIDSARVGALEAWRVTPAFKRRAFVSDIMTWNYNFADRLDLHLRHDREFIPWMARRGINAFSYICHAHDRRLKIDEIAPLLRERAIDVEYGGHVLQLLLPRERFAERPEYFPAGDDGVRIARGNLCVSNPDAVAIVRAGALAYVHDHPENRLLHIWGADVWRGAWCRCGRCRELPPQIQYMTVVNAIAGALAEDSNAPPIAYLAYHDTIDPHPALRPLDNVWFEWAPRERCYSHAIDDPACEINPHYLESLKRYIEIFDGRGHVFEYYADAILFCGLGFATPAVVARDLRAYRSLGITSISCLTFGAYSAMAYPVNLEAFVRGSRDPDFEPATTLVDISSGRHPRCAPEMAAAYRAVERASKLCLDYGDVMRLLMPSEKAVRKRDELREAALTFNEAIAAADQIAPSLDTPLADAEKDLWRYSSEVLAGLSDYLGALGEAGADRRIRGKAAIAKVAGAIERIREIDPEIKGTWGAYDLEWIREIWLSALARGLDGDGKPPEELF